MLPGEHSAENGDQNHNLTSLNSLKPKVYVLMYIMYLFSSLNGILCRSSFKYLNVKDLNCEYINFVKYRVTN